MTLRETDMGIGCGNWVSEPDVGTVCGTGCRNRMWETDVGTVFLEPGAETGCRNRVSEPDVGTGCGKRVWEPDVGARFRELRFWYLVSGTACGHRGSEPGFWNSLGGRRFVIQSPKLIYIYLCENCVSFICVL